MRKLIEQIQDVIGSIEMDEASGAMGKSKVPDMFKQIEKNHSELNGLIRKVEHEILLELDAIMGLRGLDVNVDISPNGNMLSMEIEVVAPPEALKPNTGAYDEYFEKLSNWTKRAFPWNAAIDIKGSGNLLIHGVRIVSTQRK